MGRDGNSGTVKIGTASQTINAVDYIGELSVFKYWYGYAITWSGDTGNDEPFLCRG